MKHISVKKQVSTSSTAYNYSYILTSELHWNFVYSSISQPMWMNDSDSVFGSIINYIIEDSRGIRKFVSL